MGGMADTISPEIGMKDLGTHSRLNTVIGLLGHIRRTVHVIAFPKEKLGLEESHPPEFVKKN